MIRITDYGVIAAKPSVRKLGQIFRTSCRENYTLGRKMDDNFLMGTTSSITMQHLGKIERLAPAVGAKNVVFLPAGCREAANCRY